MKDLEKFHRLAWSDRLLLAEALIVLAAASAAIAVLPFRLIAGLAGQPLRRPVPAADTRLETARRVRWAILACASRVPWRAVCFQNGLTAQFMLRRRGVPSVLYYGAARDAECGLVSHVWVCDGNINIVGGETASGFAVLAMFPSQTN